MVLLTLGALAILTGSAAVALANRLPAHRSRLEQWGAAAFIAGVAFVGFAVPLA